MATVLLPGLAGYPTVWLLLSIFITTCAVLSIKMDQRPGLFERLGLLLLIALGAMLGGNLWVSLEDVTLVEYLRWFSPSQLLNGEKSSIGATLGMGVVAGLFYLARLPVLAYADKLVPYLALAYAMARMGCFANGDDFGVVTDLPWSVRFGPGTQAYAIHLQRGWIEAGYGASLTVHPTQLYHAGAGLIGFFLLTFWKPAHVGERFAIALIGYGVARFFIQFVRDDHSLAGISFDTVQWFCLLFLAVGCLLLVHIRREHAPMPLADRLSER